MEEPLCKFTLYQLPSAMIQAPHVGSKTKYGSTLKFQHKPLKLRRPQDMVGRSFFRVNTANFKHLQHISSSRNAGLDIQLTKSSPRRHPEISSLD
jgi:hypothetical protein